MAYNKIVAKRFGQQRCRSWPFPTARRLNLAQGKFGQYTEDVRWLAAAGTDYGMVAVNAESTL